MPDQELTIDRLDELTAACQDEEQSEILALARECLVWKNRRTWLAQAGPDSAQAIADAIADAHGTEEVGAERAKEGWTRTVFRIGTRDALVTAREFLKCSVADTPYYRGYRAELQRLIAEWEPRIQAHEAVMPRWKLVPSGDPEDLRDTELIGLSVAANAIAVEDDIYRKAWEKIQPQVQVAIERDL